MPTRHLCPTIALLPPSTDSLSLSPISQIVAHVTERCFLRMESPPLRICGHDTPFPLVHEPYYVPDELRVLEGIKAAVRF